MKENDMLMIAGVFIVLLLLKKSNYILPQPGPAQSTATPQTRVPTDWTGPSYSGYRRKGRSYYEEPPNMTSATNLLSGTQTNINSGTAFGSAVNPQKPGLDFRGPPMPGMDMPPVNSPYRKHKKSYYEMAGKSVNGMPPGNWQNTFVGGGSMCADPRGCIPTDIGHKAPASKPGSEYDISYDGWYSTNRGPN
jgi:hypothetical protein